MRINSINNSITFQKISLRDNDKGIKIFDDFSCRTSDEDHTVHNISISENIRQNNNSYNIKFSNDYSGLAAKEYIVVHPKKDYIYIGTMDSIDKNRGLGTCMHLINIIEMLENNSDGITLKSSPTAVPFHIKMGFYPNSRWDDGLSINLIKIKNNNYPELKSYAQEAEDVLNSHIINFSEASEKGNRVLNSYIKAANKILPREELMYLCSYPIDMKLTRKYVIEHKEHYNELLKKYNIDYIID